MAVTIDEMHVDVQKPPAAASAPTSDAGPKKDMDMREALEVMNERKQRLRAD
ncbi:MAG: hypothetical protein ABSD59_15610 [Terracidiphilus sp.]|jgi:hypothetical protein